MVLEELGLEEDKLYKISKKEYLVNHPELNQEKIEIQDKRYDHYEKRRQEAIEHARQIRNEIIKKESNTEEQNHPNKTSKYSRPSSTKWDDPKRIGKIRINEKTTIRRNKKFN